MDSDFEFLSTWFRHCYRQEFDGATGWTEWTLQRLPDSGSVAEQDAWLMHGMAEIASVMNQIAGDDRRDAEKKRKQDAEKGKRRG